MEAARKQEFRHCAEFRRYIAELSDLAAKAPRSRKAQGSRKAAANADSPETKILAAVEDERMLMDTGRSMPVSVEDLDRERTAINSNRKYFLKWLRSGLQADRSAAEKFARAWARLERGNETARREAGWHESKRRYDVEKSLAVHYRGKASHVEGAAGKVELHNARAVGYKATMDAATAMYPTVRKLL